MAVLLPTVQIHFLFPLSLFSQQLITYRKYKLNVKGVMQLVKWFFYRAPLLSKVFIIDILSHGTVLHSYFMCFSFYVLE